MRMTTSQKEIKGLGNDRSAYTHWKWQRISAIFLIPLLAWFFYHVFEFFYSPDAVINLMLYSPFHLIAFIIFWNLMMYHGAVGARVILEDYIPNKSIRAVTILGCYALSSITAVVLTLLLIINFTKHL